MNYDKCCRQNVEILACQVEVKNCWLKKLGDQALML